MSRFIVAIIALLALALPARAGEEIYDTSFMSGHKVQAPSYALQANDFHRHSYHRKLLKSKRGRDFYGSVKRNPMYSHKAFNYVNPDTLNDERNKPSALDPYLDNAYDKPTLMRSFNPAYAARSSVEKFPSAPPVSSYGQAFENPFSLSGPSSASNPALSRPQSLNSIPRESSRSSLTPAQEVFSESMF